MLVVFVTVCMLYFTMRMYMGMAVRMRMLVRVSMVMVMMLASLWIVVMVALMAVTVQVHIKFHPFDAGFVFPFGVQVKLIQPKFRQFRLQLIERNTQIQHCSYEHVATDSAEKIEVKRLHLFSIASALIWLVA